MDAGVGVRKAREEGEGVTGVSPLGESSEA